MATSDLSLRPPPPLENGDCLTRAEFERRYAAMPELKKAELIEGIVYMPSPVRIEQHGGPHADLMVWLGYYRAHTPGVRTGDNTTVKLDLDNEPQPDAVLRILPQHGGQSWTDEDGYVNGAPELIAEVTASSASYDLHIKHKAYRRSGVREYVVWRVLDQEVDWFVLRESQYQHLVPDSNGIIKSEIFPGLWLNTAALLQGNLATVLTTVQEGINSPEYNLFVVALAHTP